MKVVDFGVPWLDFLYCSKVLKVADEVLAMGFNDKLNIK